MPIDNWPINMHNLILTKLEPTRESSLTSPRTTALRHSTEGEPASTAAIHHVEQHFCRNTSAHATSHTASTESSTTTEHVRRVNKVLATVEFRTLLRIRERFVRFTNVLEALCRCFVARVLFHMSIGAHLTASNCQHTLSGWLINANFLYAFLMSLSFASLSTPSSL